MVVEATIAVGVNHLAQEEQSPRTCWITNSALAELFGITCDDHEARPLRTDYWNGDVR